MIDFIKKLLGIKPRYHAILSISQHEWDSLERNTWYSVGCCYKKVDECLVLDRMFINRQEQRKEK